MRKVEEYERFKAAMKKLEGFASGGDMFTTERDGSKVALRVYDQYRDAATILFDQLIPLLREKQPELLAEILERLKHEAVEEAKAARLAADQKLTELGA